MKQTTEKKRKKWIGIALLVFVVLFFAGLAWLVGKPLIQFLGTPEKFREWVDDKGIWGRLAFVGMVVVQVLVALIPGEPFEIAAGYAFGPWEGALWCMLGTVLGSILVFLLVRRFGKPLVNLFFPDKQLDNLKFLNTGRKRNVLFFVLMILPGTPKDLLSYMAGLTKIPLGTWIWMVAVTRIPSVLTSTLGGGALGEKKYIYAVVVFGVTLLLSGAGVLIYRMICRHRQTEERKE